MDYKERMLREMTWFEGALMTRINAWERAFQDLSMQIPLPCREEHILDEMQPGLVCLPSLGSF